MDTQRRIDEIWKFVYGLHGVSLRAVEHDGTGGSIEVIAQTRDPERLRALLDDRYGAGGVTLVEVGPPAPRPTSRPSREILSFAGWDVDGSGRELTVFLIGGAHESNYRLALDEGPDQVVATLVADVSAGVFPAVGYSQAVSAQLSTPLGKRAVVDGSDGQRRTRGRRYE